MTEITTYRYAVSGEWGYAWYAGRVPVGGCSCQISMSSAVRITGNEVLWYSQFGIDNMIVPGTSRQVKDNQTGLEVYRLVFWQPGKYEVRTKEASACAEIRNGIYLFGRPLMPVTAMT